MPSLLPLRGNGGRLRVRTIAALDPVPRRSRVVSCPQIFRQRHPADLRPTRAARLGMSGVRTARSRGRALVWALTLAVPAGLSMVAAVAFGPAHIGLTDVGHALLHRLGGGAAVEPGAASWQETVIWSIRLPRALLGFAVGGALALTGAALQGLFRNPLAEPSILGVSAGASLGAVVTIFFGLAARAVWLLPAGAFAGAALTAFVVLGLAARSGRGADLHHDDAAGRRRRRRAQHLVHDLPALGLAQQLRRRPPGHPLDPGRPRWAYLGSRPAGRARDPRRRRRDPAARARARRAAAGRGDSAVDRRRRAARADGAGAEHVAADRRRRRRRRTDRVRRPAGAAYFAPGGRADPPRAAAGGASSAAASSSCWPISPRARCSRRWRSRSAWSPPPSARRSFWRCSCGAARRRRRPDEHERQRDRPRRGARLRLCRPRGPAGHRLLRARRRGHRPVRPERRREIDAAAADPRSAPPARRAGLAGRRSGDVAPAARDRAAGGTA